MEKSISEKMLLLQIIVRSLIFILGLGLATFTLVSAIRSFVLPRGVPDLITASVFKTVRYFFNLRVRHAQSYTERDHIMALYAPISLLSLPPVWLVLVLIGYMGMFWALDLCSLKDTFLLSGSSLLTLGFANVHSVPQMILAFSEATIGLILVALLIAYLPAMYDNFSRRETAVTRLAVRAGTPPSPVEMILRLHRIGELDNLRDFWEEWETLFAEIAESHTSLAPLVFFRSQDPEQSWITASGTVMDGAALILSSVAIPYEPQGALCVRAGYLALQQIATVFDVSYNSAPHFPQESISISREEFDEVLQELAAYDVPLKKDKEQAWLDYAGWRVNYDTVLLALSALVMAPYARWSSDRSHALHSKTNQEILKFS